MTQPTEVWLNGALIPAHEVRISAFAPGLLLGVSAFETMVAVGGAPFEPQRHFVRLCASCERLRLPLPTYETFREGLYASMVASGLDSGEAVARLRFTIIAQEPPLLPLHLATAVPKPAWPASARLALAQGRKDPLHRLSGAKVGSYAETMAELAAAKAQGADEALFLTPEGWLSECGTSNVFFVRKGEVFTPSLDCGCLPGITRGIVLELCAENKMAVHEGHFDLNALLLADEAFITSSTREIQPVASLLAQAEFSTEGEITTALKASFASFKTDSLASVRR